MTTHRWPGQPLAGADGQAEVSMKAATAADLARAYESATESAPKKGSPATAEGCAGQPDRAVVASEPTPVRPAVDAKPETQRSRDEAPRSSSDEPDEIVDSAVRRVALAQHFDGAALPTPPRPSAAALSREDAVEAIRSTRDVTEAVARAAQETADVLVGEAQSKALQIIASARAEADAVLTQARELEEAARAVLASAQGRAQVILDEARQAAHAITGKAEQQSRHAASTAQAKMAARLAAVEADLRDATARRATAQRQLEHLRVLLSSGGQQE